MYHFRFWYFMTDCIKFTFKSPWDLPSSSMSGGSCIHKIGDFLLYPCRIRRTVHCVCSSALNRVTPDSSLLTPVLCSSEPFFWPVFLVSLLKHLWTLVVLLCLGWLLHLMCLRDHSIYSVTPVSPRLTPFLSSEPLPSSRLLTWLIMANMDVLKQCHSGYERWHLEGSTSRAGMMKRMCLSSWFRFDYLKAYYHYLLLHYHYLYHYFQEFILTMFSSFLW